MSVNTRKYYNTGHVHIDTESKLIFMLFFIKYIIWQISKC